MLPTGRHPMYRLAQSNDTQLQHDLDPTTIFQEMKWCMVVAMAMGVVTEERVYGEGHSVAPDVGLNLPSPSCCFVVGEVEVQW